MAFTINTNIASMQAQNYLRLNSDFQSKTINRVTSGLRLVSAGDDAAGLAIANSYRSDQAVLSQGIRNGNDGLSTLQTIDGGISNISKLLDRARTLATQSASGTYSGDRNVLNNEFQSVMAEVDRQAQAIGMNSNGVFAKNLSAFIGGGRTSGSTDQITNGSASVDLSKSTVDTQSLGLKGVQAGNSSYDLDTGTTSVSNIIANANNKASEATTGFTQFKFSGPGFGDANGVTVSVDINNVASTDALEKAVNTAIATAGASPSASGQAFAAAGITAKVITASDGTKQLAFSSSTTSFQVNGEDKMANALLGNFKTGAEGADMGRTMTYGVQSTATAFSAGDVLKFTVSGGGLASPYTFSYTTTAASSTVNAQAIQTQMASDATLKAAGITMTVADPTAGLAFKSANGENISVKVAGDTADRLGLGAFIKDGSANAEYNTISFTAATPVATNVSKFSFQLADGSVKAISVTWNAANLASDAVALNALNAAINADSGLKAIGMVASGAPTGTGTLTFTAGAGNTFSAMASSAAAAGAYGGLQAAYTYTAGTGTGNSAVNYIAAGSYQLGASSAATPLSFSGIYSATESQALTVQATDASGAVHSQAITLTNTNARTLQEAVNSINTALQQSNDTTLKGLTAVKVLSGTGTEKMELVSTTADFRLSIGKNSTGTGFDQTSTLVSSLKVGSGANQTIGTQSAAQSAVTALATAVTNLGAAQAVVGKGQNTFSYAIGLASTQLTNLAASESQIRDADLAAEAANLTKAQILTQAGVAALAQANSAPQAVLSLLKG